MKRYLLTILVPFLFLSTAWSQTTLPNSNAFESYMDGLVKTYMSENDIAGATVGVVKDGSPLLLKGYGYADIENQIKVHADRTLFRIGSVSKMFVWTAVMQLVEQDKLDLDTDVNRYLTDFKIPDTYEEPITLRNLMTHSAGFEEYVIGLFAKDTTALRPLGEILAEEMPARVRPPSKVSSYSNHGTGIAAYVIEQISGQSFEEYVEEHIFKPLDMNTTTFRQPIPDPLAANLSKGYTFEDGEYREKKFEYVPMGPIGAASTTAADMINFMQAHLQHGQFGGQKILTTSTAREMQRPAFSHSPDVNPMRHGFIDMSQNGVEIIGHGGDTFWFHSKMVLFPQHNLGLFISFNSANGSSAKERLLDDFADHFFPADNPAADTLDMSKKELNRFAGKYRANRYPHKRFTYIMALFGSGGVSVTEDGHLKTMDSGQANYWFPVDSLTFRNTKNSDVLSFEKKPNGEITHLYRSGFPIVAFEKVPLISSQKLHLALFGLAGGAFLITLFYWPLAYQIRKNYRPKMTTKWPINFLKKTTAWLNALVIIAFFVWVGVLVSSGDGEAIVYGLPLSFKAAFVLPLVSAALTVIMGYHTYKIWRERESGVWSRIWYSFLFISSGAILWQFYYWNLLGVWFS